jgi:hypothetical protein
MSEERFDSIDRKLSELVKVTGHLVTTTRDLVVKVEDNSEQIKANRESIKALIEHQKLMSNQLADIARVVINTSKKQDEMAEGFDKRITTIEEKIAA